MSKETKTKEKLGVRAANPVCYFCDYDLEFLLVNSSQKSWTCPGCDKENTVVMLEHPQVLQRFFHTKNKN